jgi:hypothetical protein
MSAWDAEFQSFEEAVDYLGGRQSRQLAGVQTRAVFLSLQHDLEGARAAIGVRYHDTTVITFFSDGTIELDSGGYRTVTTKKRMNVFLPNPLAVYQAKGEWFVTLNGFWYGKTKSTIVGFKDKMRLFQVTTDDGVAWVAEGALNLEEERERKQLRKDIDKYVKGYVNALVKGDVPLPIEADCPQCDMRTAGTGEALGEATKDSAHFRSHFKERYYVPSLLIRALEVCPSSIMDKMTVQSLMEGASVRGDMGYFKIHMRKILRRYLRAQFERAEG